MGTAGAVLFVASFLLPAAAGTYKLNNNVLQPHLPLQHQLTSATEKVREKDCRVMFKVGTSRRRKGETVWGETDYYMVGYRWSRKPGSACGRKETCVVTEVKLKHAKTYGHWFGEAKKEETGPKDVTGIGLCYGDTGKCASTTKTTGEFGEGKYCMANDTMVAVTDNFEAFESQGSEPFFASWDYSHVYFPGHEKYKQPPSS
ncbi:unnamed protein product [Vitrella brassicaformis CCMP3155]|uniref:Uncharacterized protein n=1 Tax=Vitrella brassicaformis (strain CCMP3155) TaxID=1169540 RepID=A0A0G4EJZ7_VITBC|nr:unnamed protein product [Vitrella brassicaformis CCMP3155]|mmetsp:Transcript_43186/g.107902  ORF Transcript_43186/g.107902 Transcript_43186/m.107902 type:complete len:202 (+) Transcript_43186:152-757(+)|eukprot:CEL97074.1 unnamed protein product [Vitrella brassicaformis CCMP3155]